MQRALAAKWAVYGASQPAGDSRYFFTWPETNTKAAKRVAEAKREEERRDLHRAPSGNRGTQSSSLRRDHPPRPAPQTPLQAGTAHAAPAPVFSATHDQVAARLADPILNASPTLYASGPRICWNDCLVRDSVGQRLFHDS